MTFAERASDAGYAAGWRVVRGLPDGVARRLFDKGADLAAARDGGPQQLRRNLARVLGVPADSVPDELIRASVRSYARYWREAFRLPSMNLDAQAAVIDECVHGREHLDAA
ncbi:MAG: phosphatidylinositol mannoside acyltransferase, partial [Rhodococcus sp. (in: high G+C Gram-positive bacteria)]